MNVIRPLVSVIDDDESVRESLPDLLGVFGYAARAFPSAERFLDSGCVETTRCLILDVAMPGMTGPELHRELVRRGERIPVVYVTAQRDEMLRPQLIGQGAVECLFKPFTATALEAALRSALQTA